MSSNYGYTVSYNFKGSKSRKRATVVFRTKTEASKFAKSAAKGMSSVSKVRVVKATQNEYINRNR